VAPSGHIGSFGAALVNRLFGLTARARTNPSSIVLVPWSPIVMIGDVRGRPRGVIQRVRRLVVSGSPSEPSLCENSIPAPKRGARPLPWVPIVSLQASGEVGFPRARSIMSFRIAWARSGLEVGAETFLGSPGTKAGVAFAAGARRAPNLEL